MPHQPDLAARFIARVWSMQPRRSQVYGIVANKDWGTGAWSNRPLQIEPRHQRTSQDYDLDDLYFTPCLFDIPRALKQHALPSRVLYADLDEVDPRSLEIAPTLAWQTSKGRYQALWLLDRHVSPKAFESLNQRLTYATGADKGGWSSTKVLRVPGSRSTKYERPFRVKLVHLKRRRRYRLEEMRALLKDIDTTPRASGLLPPANTLPDPKETYAKRRKQIPVRGRQLLRTGSLVAGEDRSARLWELQSLLVGAGLEPAEIYVLVQRSIWNKYKGQRREAVQLWSEISKAVANKAAPASAGTSETDQPETRAVNRPRKKHKREMVRVSDFRTRTYATPSWLVNQMWTRSAFGFLAGESKTYKSLLALDMAVSVASGTPFLDYFQVPAASRGPVLLWQEENDEGLVQERLRRIEFARGLGPTSTGFHLNLAGREYPLIFGNRQSIDLNDEHDLKYILRQIHRYKPRLVILDPLYMMVPELNENEASEMTPMLRNLMNIQRDTKTTIQVVHHYKKPQAGTKGERAMHRLSGTGVFGRRYDSAMWVEVLSEDENKPVIRLASSHRAQIAGGTYVISFAMPDDDEMSYEASVRPWSAQDDLEDEAARSSVRLDYIASKAPSRAAHMQIDLPSIVKPTRVASLARDMDIPPTKLRKAYEAAGYELSRAEHATSRYYIVHPRKKEA